MLWNGIVMLLGAWIIILWLLGEEPRHLCHMGVPEVPRLSLTGLVGRHHAILCLYMAVCNQIGV